MDDDPACIALKICEEMNRLHNLLWSMFEDQLIDMTLEKGDIPTVEEPLEPPF